jgi:DNA-binding NarL/FixJ family response regulator
VNARLSPREEQVLDLRCRAGLTNKEVAAALGISDQTVKNHVTHILRKYGAQGMDRVCWFDGFGQGVAWSAPAMRPEMV